MLAASQTAGYAVPDLVNAALPHKRPLLRHLYRSGADVFALTAAMSWAYASLVQDLPYVPWEYPCAVAACVWVLIVVFRNLPRFNNNPAELLLLLPAAVLLTCFTAADFLGYLAPAAALLILIYLRCSPLKRRFLAYIAATTAVMAPAVFLEFHSSLLALFLHRGWWPLLIFLTFSLNELLFSALVDETS